GSGKKPAARPGTEWRSGWPPNRNCVRGSTAEQVLSIDGRFSRGCRINLAPAPPSTPSRPTCEFVRDTSVRNTANGNPTFQGVQFGSASPHVSQRIPANYQSSSRPATRKGSGPGGDGPAPRLFSVRPDQTGARPRNASAIKAITARIRNRKNRTLAA